MSQTNQPVVLVIDPDPLTLMGLSATLHHEKMEVHGARSRTAALRAAQDLALDLIVVDSWIEPDFGASLMRAIRMLPHLVDVPAVFVAEPEHLKAVQLPPASFHVSKPLNLDALVDVVKRAVWMPHLVHSHQATPRPHSFAPISQEGKSPITVSNSLETS